MFFETRKFMLTVSLCAMLAVNPVLADVPKENESVGDAHTVYVDSTLENGTLSSVKDYKTAGIASVSYVHRMVDAAGNAAQAAESHAAAAGDYALSAAQSADEAHEVLKDKVDIEQGDENANKVMVTDEDGTVYPGYVTVDNISSSGNTGIVIADGTGVFWGGIESGMIGTGAIQSWHITQDAIDSHHIISGAIIDNHIAYGAIHSGHIASGTITANHITSNEYTGVLYSDASGYAHWGMIPSDYISNASVTTDKIYSNGHTGVLFASSNGKVSWAKISGAYIDYGSIVPIHIAAQNNYTGVLHPHGTVAVWGMVSSGDIADGAVTESKIGNGAVTIDKTDGVVGMVPVGSADATTYANFWIE